LTVPLAIPPYLPRASDPTEAEELRAKLDAAEKTVARQREDITALVGNGVILCDTLRKYCIRIHDHPALALIDQFTESFTSYLPKK
jgi:hypothetical protein